MAYANYSLKPVTVVKHEYADGTATVNPIPQESGKKLPKA
jgi:hypothetical protein